jgi:hypothetical protein
MQSARRTVRDISALVRFWHSDKMYGTYQKYRIVNLKTCVNRLWTVDLEIWNSLFMPLVEENVCSARTAVSITLISSHASIYSSTRGGYSEDRNCASCSYNVAVEYAMALEPSVSTRSLCITKADIDFNCRYILIDRWSIREMTS